MTPEEIEAEREYLNKESIRASIYLDYIRQYKESGYVHRFPYEMTVEDRKNEVK